MFNMNICPVCAYTNLEFPPTNYSICACCGTEFGYDDRVLSHPEQRKVGSSKESHVESRRAQAGRLMLIYN